jgi:hypothetical protein
MPLTLMRTLRRAPGGVRTRRRLALQKRFCKKRQPVRFRRNY